MRSRTFCAGITVIVVAVVVQSIVHLVVVLGEHRRGTVVDLDRSNGIPDLLSTAALAFAAGGAAALACGHRRGGRACWALLTALLALLTVADLVHDGAHPSSFTGTAIIGVACATAIALGLAGLTAGRRARATLSTALFCLLTSFLVIGLDRADHRFERARGEPIAEYQIVAKEGLELIGWALVAVALWDEALGRRRRGWSRPSAIARTPTWATVRDADPAVGALGVSESPISGEVGPTPHASRAQIASTLD